MIKLANFFLRQDILEFFKKNKFEDSLFFTDKLTLLPNRDKLVTKLINEDKNFSLLLVNINGFKEINNFYGHTIGDVVLGKVATVLENKTMKTLSGATLFKMHSDEFGILIEKSLTKNTIDLIVESIIKSFKNNPLRARKHKLHIGVGIGSATITKDRSDRAELITEATIALKQAKLDAKPHIMFDKDAAVFKEYKNNLLWVKRIKTAIRDRNIKTFFQPIFNNSTNTIEKHECLMRLKLESGEVVTPFFFLDISKRNHLYLFLTKMMIENVFEQAHLIKTGLTINISIEDLQSKEVRELIYSKLNEFEDPSKFTFEITETDEIENFKIAEEFIDVVKEKNVKIAIDDFGSGYSNFEYILRLNVDYIKIDGSLIKNIHRDNNSQIIVETIVSFAKKMGIKVVAEFVSNEEIFKKVNEIGINFSQGYYIGEATKEPILKPLN